MALVTRVPTGYDALTGEVKAWDVQEVLNIENPKAMKVLVATEKPFAKKAVDGIREIVEGAGYELALLEKYTDKGHAPARATTTSTWQPPPSAASW